MTADYFCVCRPSSGAYGQEMSLSCERKTVPKWIHTDVGTPHRKAPEARNISLWGNNATAAPQRNNIFGWVPPQENMIYKWS